MATKLALEYLYESVVARFTAEGTAATQVFGWREPPKQLAGPPRIVWVPGDPAGSLGEIGGARYPGRNQTSPDPDLGRPLATLRELFTCYIHAEDASDPQDELLQFKAARLLYDAWYRAVYLAAHGIFLQRSAAWHGDPNERRRGATIRVVASVESMIPDSPLALAPADTAAHVTPSIPEPAPAGTDDPVMIVEPE